MDFRRAIIHLLLSIGVGLILLLCNGCVKQEFNQVSNNVVINQSFSVPIGTRTFTLDAPDSLNASVVPGLYGFFSLDGFQYTNDQLWFDLYHDTIPFALSDTKHSDWIKSVVITPVFGNTFPTKVNMQVVMLDAGKSAMDALFKPDPLTINAATNVVEKNDTLSSIRLEYLKHTKYLVFQGQVCSKQSANDAGIIQFTSRQTIVVKIGLQVNLQYNIKDLGN